LKLRRLAIKLPAEIAFAEKHPVASIRIKVEAVLAVSIWAVFNREISMVLSFLMAVIFHRCQWMIWLLSRLLVLALMNNIYLSCLALNHYYFYWLDLH
jgi:hypothetical protein